MTHTENLYLALLELDRQLRTCLDTQPANEHERRQRQQRLHDVNLLALQSVRTELRHLREDTEELPRRDPLWCPPTALRDRLRSRRTRYVPIDPFAAPHRPRR